MANANTISNGNIIATAKTVESFLGTLPPFPDTMTATLMVGLMDGIRVGKAEGALVTLAEGLEVDGLIEGPAVGRRVGFADGALVGLLVTTGFTLGVSEGFREGTLLGALVGTLDGALV